jgi:hypothetical protein
MLPNYFIKRLKKGWNISSQVSLKDLFVIIYIHDSEKMYIHERASNILISFGNWEHRKFQFK